MLLRPLLLLAVLSCFNPGLFSLGSETGETYYELLQVSTKASMKEVKKAYRAMALKYHPDKIALSATEEEREAAEQRFMRMSKAYEVLSDEMIRNRYNTLVENGIYEYDEKTWNTFVYENDPPSHGFGMLSEDTPWWVDATMTCVIATCVLIPLFMRYNERVKKAKQDRANKSSLLRDITSQQQRVQAAAATASTNNNNPPKKKLRKEKQEEEFAEIQFERRKTEGSNTKNGPVEAPKSKHAGSHVWSEEELSILAKAIAKFPGGASRRWQAITNMLTKRCGSTKSQKQVIQKAREMEFRAMGYRTSNNKTNGALSGNTSMSSSGTNSSGSKSVCNITDKKNVSRQKSGLAGDVASDSTKRKTTSMSETPSSLSSCLPQVSSDASKKNSTRPSDISDWNAKQQSALEMALRQISKADCEKNKTDRWQAIADCVPGKSKRQCIQRFKHIRSLIKTKASVKSPAGR
eukprot:jgi/Bigna1/87526/estExt_fgenesh1_pg.C_210121